MRNLDIHLHNVEIRSGVFRRTIIFTRHNPTGVEEYDGTENEEIVATHHINIVEEGAFEENAEDVPSELEEGIKATMDKLKEVNLNVMEDSRPVYISAFSFLKNKKLMPIS